jgi:hypothetical protein
VLEKFADDLRLYTPRIARQPWWRLAVEAVVLAGIFFVLHLAYYSQPTFLDEFDNMIGGNVVAHGGAIYVDYLSQHTPIAYWLSGLGHLFGAEFFGGQRLFGFLLFSVLLATLYARNARQFGRIPLIVVGVLVSTMHFYNPELSYTVLSDNYQALMGLFLLFEVVGLAIRRDRSLQRWIVIGLVSAFSFGVAFVSIYFIAGAVLTAATLSVIDARRTVRGFAAWAGFVGARAGVFLAPFVVLIGAVWATGALAGAYEQAYVLNRTAYAEYLGGFGSSVVEPLYYGFTEIWSHLTEIPQTFEMYPVAAIREIIALAVLAVATVIFVRLRPVLGIGVLWMASLVATRGWNGFHAQPLWAFMIGLLGILVFLTIAALRSENARRVGPRVGAALLSAVVVIANVPYAVEVYDSRSTLTTPVLFPNPNRSEVIRTLVPEGGSYGELGINNAYDFVVTGRLPAGGFSGVVPWFSDMMDDEMASKLSADDPILIFSDESNDVWGFNVIENAPALAEVIDEGYTRIDLSEIGVQEGVFIRTDALESSLRDLRVVFPGTKIGVYEGAGDSAG